MKLFRMTEDEEKAILSYLFAQGIASPALCPDYEMHSLELHLNPIQ